MQKLDSKSTFLPVTFATSSKDINDLGKCFLTNFNALDRSFYEVYSNYQLSSYLNEFYYTFLIPFSGDWQKSGLRLLKIVKNR